MGEIMQPSVEELTDWQNQDQRDRGTQAWARWLARGFDGVLTYPFVMALFAGLGAAVALGLAPHVLVAWTTDKLMSQVVGVVVVLIVFVVWDTLFISNTGTTPASG